MDQRAHSESPRMIFNEDAEESDPAEPAQAKINAGLDYSEIYGLWNFGEVPASEKLTILLAKILQSMVDINAGRVPQKSVFNSAKIPGISIENYLKRIGSFSHCSIEAMVFAVIYIDRYLEALPELFIHAQNVHKSFN